MAYEEYTRRELRDMAAAIRVELDSRPSICVECGSTFVARAQARTCSPTCRVAHSTRGKSLPVFLTSQPRWVRHDEKKTPLSAVTGHPVDITDESVTVDYETAKKSVYGVGLGFVLTGDGLACYDLDGCLSGGVITDEGLALVQGISEKFRYIEVSQSGRGLHIWVNSPPAKGTRTPGLEKYSKGRYLTITSRRVSAAALVARAEIVD